MLARRQLCSALAVFFITHRNRSRLHSRTPRRTFICIETRPQVFVVRLPDGREAAVKMLLHTGVDGNTGKPPQDVGLALEEIW